jgi:hypothetical protein
MSNDVTVNKYGLAGGIAVVAALAGLLGYAAKSTSPQPPQRMLTDQTWAVISIDGQGNCTQTVELNPPPTDYVPVEMVGGSTPPQAIKWYGRDASTGGQLPLLINFPQTDGSGDIGTPFNDATNKPLFTIKDKQLVGPPVRKADTNFPFLNVTVGGRPCGMHTNGSGVHVTH